MLFNCFKQKWQSLTDDQKAIIICYTIGAIIAALFIFIIVDKAFGKDFGVQGHRWEIAETDILEYIEKKLVAVDIEKLTEEMIKKTTERVEEPEPVSGIVDVIFGKATKYYYDPSYIVP